MMTHRENESEIKNYKKQQHSANYLNNLLLETIHTLNSMRDVISSFNKQPPAKTHLKENINSEKKTVHQMFKDEKEESIDNIRQEINSVGQLIKSIFQKVDDSNYQCQDEICLSLRKNKEEDISTPNTKSNEYQRNDLNETKNQESIKIQLPNIKEKTNSKSKHLIGKFKFDPECKNKKNIALLQNKKLCTCSSIEEYYRNEGCIYINYSGRILLIDCMND